MSARRRTLPHPSARCRPRHPPNDAFVLGRSIITRAPFALPMDALTRGVHVLGAIGAGKTSLLRALLLARDSQLPWVHHDYIGTGHRHLETMVALAGSRLAAAEAFCPERAGVTARFLARFAFLSIGDRNPAVRFDLLRRRTLPDGSRESVRDVTGRALQVLFTKLDDRDESLRVRFRRVATALLACLTAAERPITEALYLLNDPSYIAFLERELHGRTFYASDHRFLTHQLRELHHVLLLRPTDPSKSWRAFEEMTESTRNSLADLAPGTLLGELFGAETVPLEAIAFGRGCLSVTTRHPDETLKSQAFQAIHAMLHTLFLHRPAARTRLPLLYLVDEPWWVRRHFSRILAVSRNLGVSYVVSHQSPVQFDAIGLPTLAREMRALTNLRITFRPTAMEDAEDELLHTQMFAPDGLVQRFTVSGSGSGGSTSVVHADGWSKGQRIHGSGIDWTNGINGSDAVGDGSSWSESEHETINVVGARDQLFYAAQRALRRPRFTGTVVWEGVGTEVAFARTPEVPPVVAGIPLLDPFRRWHDRHWRSRLIQRTPYDPSGPIELASSARAQVAPHAPPEAAPRPANDDAPSDSAEPAPARTPVPPPAYGAQPPAPSRGRRRRRRGGKRDV